MNIDDAAGGKRPAANPDPDESRPESEEMTVAAGDRPPLLAVSPDGIPAELTALPQWVNWRLERREEKWTKVPYLPAGRKASSTDPSTWSPWSKTLGAYLAGHFDGIGFVFAADDGYFGIDLDHVVNEQTQEVAPWVMEIVEFMNSYTELSVTGTGLHIIGRGSLPEGRRRRGPIETYDTGRYFTMTGAPPSFAGRTAIRDCSDVLATFHARYLADAAAPAPPNLTATTPVLDDAQLLARARAAANGAKFSGLFDHGDASAYGGDQSAADLALVSQLVWWCAGDGARADRLFRHSALYREKWDRRHRGDGATYGQITVERALGHFSISGASPRSGIPIGETPWGEMKELPSKLPPAPSLPPSLLPEPLAPALIDAATRMAVPLEFVAAPALVAAAAVIGRRIAIKPELFNDWMVVPNLWGAIIGHPGWLKSPSIQEAMRPIRQLAARAREEYEAACDRVEAEKERLAAEVTVVKEQMKAAIKREDPEAADQSEQRLATLKTEIGRLEDFQERRYLTQDVTVEKLGELLARNPTGLLILRDELAGWLMTLEKPGREGEREFYLEAWNGDGSFTFDRIGRGTVHIDALTVSIFGGIQPGKLGKWVRDALLGAVGADGLLQRLQIMVWPDSLGPWEKATHWPETVAKKRMFDIFSRLDLLTAAELGADLETDIPTLHFAPDAQQLFDAWRAELEERLRGGSLDAFPAFASHLSKYRSLMPSLALIFHLIDFAADASGGFVSAHPGEFGTVSLTAARRAAEWCDFLETHARKVYAAELRPGVEDAHALAGRIQSGSVVDGMPIRDIYRKGWSSLNTPDSVDAALTVLEEAGWVRRETLTDTGGRPSDVVRVHPQLRTQS